MAVHQRGERRRPVGGQVAGPPNGGKTLVVLYVEGLVDPNGFAQRVRSCRQTAEEVQLPAVVVRAVGEQVVSGYVSQVEPALALHQEAERGEDAQEGRSAARPHREAARHLLGRDRAPIPRGAGASVRGLGRSKDQGTLVCGA